MTDFCLGHTGLGTAVILSKFSSFFFPRVFSHILRTGINKIYNKVLPDKTRLPSRRAGKMIQKITALPGPENQNPRKNGIQL